VRELVELADPVVDHRLRGFFPGVVEGCHSWFFLTQAAGLAYGAHQNRPTLGQVKLTYQEKVSGGLRGCGEGGAG
jgi:hypothetical protein